jgi:DNA polymerase-3 subunit delta'
MLSAWLNRRVRGEKEPDSAAEPPSALIATPLESWAEVWETLRRSVDQADELNLDRKRTVLSILMSLARATRM